MGIVDVLPAGAEWPSSLDDNPSSIQQPTYSVQKYCLFPISLRCNMYYNRYDIQDKLTVHNRRAGRGWLLLCSRILVTPCTLHPVDHS